MTGWDTIIMVDWSSGRDRGGTPKADAIWAARARGGRAERPVYLRNRALAEDWLVRAVDDELAAGRSVLMGFDFPFGYPAGFARTIAGSDDPLALWDWLSDRIQDDGDTNNRFDVAGELNAMLPGIGPFWGNGLKRDIKDLPRKGRSRRGHGMAERRQAEARAPGAFPVWQLSGAGAAGGQALVGIPMLNRLRRRWRQARIWPFQPLDGAIGIVEVWPSLTVGPVPDGWVRDSWQVHEVARVVSGLDDGELETILSDAPTGEEGWIFGLGFEDALQGTLTPPRLTNDCFALPPGVDWTPVEVALDRLQNRLGPVVGTAKCDVRHGSGRVLAQDAVAARSHPPSPNSAVDGYGFAGGRGAGTHVVPLADGRSAAGQPYAGAVPEGAALRILTGATLPAGVDTVVLQEDVTVSKGTIAFRGPVRKGANTRAAGEDVRAGQTALPAGRRLTPADMGLLASVGVTSLDVFEPLRVAVLSTGDELVEAGGPLGEGQIADANRPMLLSLIARLGHVPVDMGIAPDSRAKLRRYLDKAARTSDVILTSGGASAGEEDHMSALLEEAGALALWRIAIKPGRPLALGMWQGTPVFGLPGNPVAAMVCALVFARPALARMAGEGWAGRQGYDLPAGFEKNKKPGRREFLRARVRDGRVEVFQSEGSGRISGLSWAEGLVELDEDERHILPGDPVRFIPWGGFGL